MPQAGFKSTIPASERPQTYVLDRAVNGIGKQAILPMPETLGSSQGFPHS